LQQHSNPFTTQQTGFLRRAVILAAVFIIFSGYLAVGFAGYLAYPTTVSSNVLKTFPKRPILLKVRCCPSFAGRRPRGWPCCPSDP